MSSKKTTTIHMLATLGTLLVLTSLIFGAIIPPIKSRQFIVAAQNIRNAKTLEDIDTNIDYALNFPSPVGREEGAKFLVGILADITGNGRASSGVIRSLISMGEPYLLKDNPRHLIILGRMYFFLWRQTCAEGLSDSSEPVPFRTSETCDWGAFSKSEEHFLTIRKIGPTIPQPLYFLLEIYNSAGDEQKVLETSEQILVLWNDPRIRDSLMRGSQ